MYALNESEHVWRPGFTRGPAGELKRSPSPRPPSRNEGPTSRGKEMGGKGGEGRGLRERKGRDGNGERGKEGRRR